MSESAQHRWIRVTYWDNEELGKYSIDIATRSEFLPEREKVLENTANHIKSLDSLKRMTNITILDIRPINEIEGYLVDDEGNEIE